MKNETKVETVKLSDVIPEGKRTLIVWVDTIEFWHFFNNMKKHLIDKCECFFPDTIYDKELLNFKAKDIIEFLTTVEQEFIADQYVLVDKYPDKILFESPLLKIGRIIFMPNICNEFAVSNSVLESYKARALDVNTSYSNPNLTLETPENIVFKFLSIAMYFNYRT